MKGLKISFGRVKYAIIVLTILVVAALFMTKRNGEHESATEQEQLTYTSQPRQKVQYTLMKVLRQTGIEYGELYEPGSDDNHKYIAIQNDPGTTVCYRTKIDGGTWKRFVYDDAEDPLQHAFSFVDAYGNQFTIRKPVSAVSGRTYSLYLLEVLNTHASLYYYIVPLKQTGYEHECRAGENYDPVQHKFVPN